jgi:hypothetical protein
MPTLADLDALKPAYETMVQNEYNNHSNNFGQMSGVFIQNSIPEFDLGSFFPTEVEIDNWRDDPERVSCGWIELMKWMWGKIVEFFKWLFDL